MKTKTVQKSIPKEWQSRNFLNCVTIPTKIGGLKKSEYKNSGRFPIFDQGQQYISGYTDREDLVQRKIPVILFGDHTRVIKYIEQPYALGADGTKVFWANRQVDPSFLYQTLLRLKIPNTGYNRHFKWLKEVYINTPPLTEQKKIAKILETVDREIEKTDEIIVATEKLKKGLMQKLFTRGIGHTKFKKTKLGEMPEEWQVIAIKDAPLKFIDGDRGANYPKLSDFSSGGYCLFLNNKNIKNDQFVFSDLQFISREKDEALKKGKLCRYDVVLTTRGTVGNVAFYDDSVSFENIRINSGMILLRSFNELSPVYLYHLMKSPLLKKRYMEVSSGSAQPQLPIKSLEQIYIPIPPEDEQEKIVEISSAADEKISVNKKLKNKLTELKKGLMQDLLSGVKRINI